jgi:hypothetical protein
MVSEGSRVSTVATFSRAADSRHPRDLGFGDTLDIALIALSPCRDIAVLETLNCLVLVVLVRASLALIAPPSQSVTA